MKTHIVIHHSATADSSVLSNVGAIRDYHVNTNKWRDIGYHFILDRMGPAGRVEVVIGRLADEEGAHTLELGMNRVGLGICCVGNYDAVTPPEDLLAALRRLCRFLMGAHGIPAENVIGHREAQAAGGVPVAGRKSCPGRLFDMDAFRASLKVSA